MEKYTTKAFLPSLLAAGASAGGEVVLLWSLLEGFGCGVPHPAKLATIIIKDKTRVNVFFIYMPS
jgi:hypothetical protein